MTPADIKKIMGTRKYGVFTQKYGRFKADNSRKCKANETVEYLHYVVCNKTK